MNGMRAVAVALLLALVAAGCGGDRAFTGLRLMVPNTPGSGYDLTARSAVKTLEDEGLAHGVEVFNLPGASGAVGLARLVNERGNGKLLMQMGLGLIGATHTHPTQATVADATPIARLVEDAEAVVVPAGSPYRDLGALVAENYKVIVMDTRGHGRSPMTSSKFGFKIFAEDAEALLDSIGEKSVSILGPARFFA